MDSFPLNTKTLDALIQQSTPSSDGISHIESVYRKICRTCLCETTDNHLESNIFFTNENNGTLVRIKEIVESITGLKNNVGDKMPQHICNGCLKSVETAYSFCTRSQRIEEILKKYLEQMPTIKEEEPYSSPESITVTPAMFSMESEKINQLTDAIETEDYKVSDTTIKHQCNICNMNFTNQLSLGIHKAEHDTPTDKRKLYKCGICSKEYSFRNGLHNHMITTHVQKREFQCPVCCRKFKRRYSLEQHMKTFCVAPDEMKKIGKAASQITVYPFDDSANAANLTIEIKNFSCSMCDGIFELEADFMSHLPKHAAEKQCPYCKKFFSRPINLESHIRSHTTERPFLCPLCSKGFTATRTLRNHLKAHTKREAYMCNTCGKTYFAERELLRHLKTHDQDLISLHESKSDDALSCAKDEWIKSNKLKEHVFKQESDSVIDVNPVEATGLSIASSLNNNQQRKMDSERVSLNYLTNTAVSFDTPVCKMDSDFNISKDSNVFKREFEEPIEALDNQQVHPESASKDSNVFKKEIDKPIDVLDSQQVHPVSDQTLENPAADFEIIVKEEQPDEGHSTFEITNEPLSDDELNQSQEESSHVSAEAIYGMFTCVVKDCKVEFKYYRDIITHYTSQHCLGPAPYQCPVCLQAFPVKVGIRKHLKSHLRCEYKCPYCPRAYWQLRDLKIHLRTHTGERPFKCTECPKRFKQRPAMRVHIKTHSISKEYKCEICSKEFFSYNGLFLHTKSHTEIKELQCTFCNKQFPTKSRLQRHLNGLCSIRTSAKS